MVAVLVLRTEAVVVVQAAAKATVAIPLDSSEEDVSDGAKVVDDHR
jgi:hypothetical protein